MLRPYQEKIIDETRRAMLRGVQSILITAPTGAGKTLLTAFMLKRAAEKGRRALFVVHRRELLKQSMEAFNRVGLKHGAIASGFFYRPDPLVHVASVQTLARRLSLVRGASLVVWDESHHLGAASWEKVHRSLPEAFHIGLTASPCRLDGKPLGKYFRELIEGPSVRELIEGGFLSRYRLFLPSSVNLDGIKSRAGDFAKEELQAAMDKPSITGDAVKHYLKLARGKRAIIFCVSIAHSQHVVDSFKAAGVRAKHVDGETPDWERDQALKAFQAGDIDVLSNVDLFGEGLDVPGIECVILLRPTQSVGLHIQQVGRGLRPAPGKDYAIILDHVQNTLRHGLPDEERKWSLTEKISRSSKSESEGPKIKVCPLCFAAQSNYETTCQFCGGEFPKKKEREIEQVEGELVEVDPRLIQLQRKKEQAKAQTLEELISLGEQRGYKNAKKWAEYIVKARQAKEAQSKNSYNGR